MRAPLSALALAASLLAACAPDAPPADAPRTADPSTVDADGFDAAAWLAAADTLGFDPETTEFDSDETVRAKALADTLDALVGWRRSCDTAVDPDTGETVYEPLDPDAGDWSRGTLSVGRVSPREAVVAVTCQFGAYQGSYALVYFRGDDAVSLRAPALDEAGQPGAVAERTFATPDWAGLDRRTFTTFAKARGIGDCGRLATYALTGSDTLAVREVRQRECGDAPPDEIDPTAWPVVYPDPGP